ncbi:MAG: DUF1329 domain-containing protein [bacterium]
MKRSTLYPIFLAGFCLCWLSCTARAALAEVKAGDMLDKNNWEDAGGLLPDAIVEWVKKGDVAMSVAELKYDPLEYLPAAAARSGEANKGKFEVNEDDLIVEKASGKVPEFIEGIPFPESEIRADDPKAGAKIMYNKYYHTYVVGNQLFPFGTIWLSRDKGFEREVKCEWHQYPMVGFAERQSESNPDGIERYSLIRVLGPYDIAGTNILLNRFLGKAMDNTFAYVPAIRRVRQMSPANRSDSFIGCDGCVDDAWLFDGKVSAFRWKLLEKKEALLPFLSEEVLPLEKEADGSLLTGKGMKQIRYGYQDDNGAAAPWMAVNLVWVKRPVYVLEMEPKDPYYNYGVQYLWVDAQVNMMAVWKVIRDRSGAYWKTVFYSYGAFATADKAVRLIGGTSMIIVDDRTDHGTIIRFPEPENQWRYNAHLDRNDYTLGGFRKICK